MVQKDASFRFYTMCSVLNGISKKKNKYGHRIRYNNKLIANKNFAYIPV